MRGQVQGLVQRVLEDEVTEFVGRTKSQRVSHARPRRRNERIWKERPYTEHIKPATLIVVTRKK